MGIAPKPQFFKKNAWLLRLIGDKTPHTARDRSEVASTLNRRCYPHTRNGGHSWCLNSSLVNRIFNPGQSHWCPRHMGLTTMRTFFLLGPLTGNYEVRMGFIVLRVRPTPIQLPINILYTPVPFHSMLNINRNSLSLANIVRNVI